jgi:hypothetical protein
MNEEDGEFPSWLHSAFFITATLFSSLLKAVAWSSHWR